MEPKQASQILERCLFGMLTHEAAARICMRLSEALNSMFC
jgi:hypothetical protein